MTGRYVVHQVPAPDADVLPCCGRDRHDPPATERWTGFPPNVTCCGEVVSAEPSTQTGQVASSTEREAHAYRVARRRLRLLHTELAGRRKDWANNTEHQCSSARAVAYQSALRSVHSILDEIEAIAGGRR